LGPEVAVVAIRKPVDLWACSDLATPWCVHVVATLRIAEHISAGTTKVDQLATAAGCDPAALARVLRHLAVKGIFRESAAGEFALTDAARGLLDPALRIGLDLDGFGGRMAGAWSSLLAAVRTGRSAYHDVFGEPFWADLDAHPDIAASFDALMGPEGHGAPDPDVLVTGDWQAVRRVVDVGGGTGALLAAILRVRPDVHGTLVDLPRTVARSGPVFAAAGVTDRVTLAGQSFFDPLPAGADLYLLKSVLADWPDPEATALLCRCAEAARPAGRVVIVSGVHPDTSTGGGDLLMMVLLGGRHRSITEFRDLAREAGLEVLAAAPNAAGRFIVECRPLHRGEPPVQVDIVRT
jgi:2,7-dihydroxy-5-methyl-1-naphthoate 7-O-methyltransferase